MIDQTVIEDVTDRIVEHFRPKRIVLFGSFARGDHNEDSDLDLLVEMESELPPVQRSLQVLRLFQGRTWPLDLFVVTPEEVRRDRNRLGTLIDIAESEGKVLYSHE